MTVTSYPFVSWLIHIKTPAGMTAAIVSVCPKCGTIVKSGKRSCCGRGGSWFTNCGGADNTKLHHTWYEGIQTCEARSKSKTVIDQQLNFAEQKGTDSSQGADMLNYKVVVATTKTFTFAPVNTSTPTLDTTSIVTSLYTSDNVSNTKSVHTLMTNAFMTSSTRKSVSSSITTQGCVNLLKITVHVNLFMYNFIYWIYWFD